jgi:hypothetical protein
MTERHPDQAWLDALAGRDADGGSDADEARRLREGILAREVVEPPKVATFDPRRESALIARARHEGLIAKPTFASWGGWQGLAALASAASVLLVLGFLLRPDRPPAPETVRSGPGGIVRIEAKGAHDLQHLIEGELRAAGVAVVVYDRLGSYGLDADLPSPVPAEVREVLRRHGIPVPEDGALKVEIVEP